MLKLTNYRLYLYDMCMYYINNDYIMQSILKVTLLHTLHTHL